ncbi:hypothetical protein [uncultured Xanthomonas sp.]|uniref:hypothetical protein n=1 Tax=uncultured Xanthomonas sp. TaxID=152831 RepID=UPI0025E4A33A|nr:hypothetical protein [uncultured Xanthomonas sp.]
MPDSAEASGFRPVRFERRRRLRRWARLRQGLCVTLACLAVALAPSWDARSAPPARVPPPRAADATADIQQAPHALRDNTVPEAQVALLR